MGFGEHKVPAPPWDHHDCVGQAYIIKRIVRKWELLRYAKPRNPISGELNAQDMVSVDAQVVVEQFHILCTRPRN